MKRKTTKSKTRKTGARKKGASKGNKLIHSAVEATVELGKAAESFQDSMKHVQKARKKGGAVVHKAKNTVKAAGKSIVKAKKRLVG